MVETSVGWKHKSVENERRGREVGRNGKEKCDEMEKKEERWLVGGIIVMGGVMTRETE